MLFLVDFKELYGILLCFIFSTWLNTMLKWGSSCYPAFREEQTENKSQSEEKTREMAGKLV